VHEIVHGRQRAVVTETGATLREWSAGGRELLDAQGPDADYRGRVLAPWPNRLRDGRYAFAGAVHRLPINEPARGCAIHGFVDGLTWDVEEHAVDRIALGLELAPRDGYPFRLRLALEYALGDAGPVVTLTATNTGDAAAPFGAGFHPYLRCQRADDARLEVPGAAVVPIDAERLLPTGPPAPVAGTDVDFRRERPIGATAVNACYADLARDAAGIARARLATADGSVTVWMDAVFGFATVYTADDVGDPARRRRSVAIEPMTCAPDAFNTGLGLRVLEPGEVLSGRWGLTPGA
jgi:aldose 1-epimerase